ncbi:MAG: hypothetical protein ACJ74U_20720, partial [Jatrophihabitantaceae bacterium]
YELADPFPRMISTNPPQANGGGGDRNSIPLYDFPSWRIESHRLELVGRCPTCQEASPVGSLAVVPH